MAISTVADIIVELLASAGVERFHGLVGDSLNGITESLRQRKSMSWIHYRHEEAAAFAAGAEAQITGKLAVCAGSCGPGNLHLINGLFDAHRSRTPVVAIAAQIPTAEIGGGYFQETNPQKLFADCSHFCEVISTPAHAARVVANAIRAATTKHGVAVIVIPGDVALMKASGPLTPSAGLVPSQPIVTPPETDLDALAALLNGSDSITLFCGRGCAGTHDALITLAGLLKAPIVHALGGKEFVEWENPFDVGMTGLIGFSSGYHAMMECDTLLMLGTDFPYRQFYPTESKIAQVDLRGENLGRRCHLDLGLIGDVGATIAALLPRLTAKTDDRHLNESLKRYAKSREGLDDLAVSHAGRKPIHPQHLARVVSDHAAEDAVFTCDVGTPTVWAARYLKMNGKRRLLGSFVHGSMANAMPQAIGVQVAFPKRQVISLSGDGGFAMLMGDLLTLTQQKLPVKIIVFNNGTLGFVELEMKATGFLPTGVDLQNPDFAVLARAAGLHALRVEDPADLDAAVAEILAHDGPALLDVVTNRQELVMPPTIQAEQVKGFGMWAMLTVMSGRGDQLIDLAVTNLRR